MGFANLDEAYECVRDPRQYAIHKDALQYMMTFARVGSMITALPYGSRIDKKQSKTGRMVLWEITAPSTTGGSRVKLGNNLTQVLLGLKEAEDFELVWNNAKEKRKGDPKVPGPVSCDDGV